MFSSGGLAIIRSVLAPRSIIGHSIGKPDGEPQFQRPDILDSSPHLSPIVEALTVASPVDSEGPSSLPADLLFYVCASAGIGANGQTMKLPSLRGRQSPFASCGGMKKNAP